MQREAAGHLARRALTPTQESPAPRTRAYGDAERRRIALDNARNHLARLIDHFIERHPDPANTEDERRTRALPYGEVFTGKFGVLNGYLVAGWATSFRGVDSWLQYYAAPSDEVVKQNPNVQTLRTFDGADISAVPFAREDLPAREEFPSRDQLASDSSGTAEMMALAVEARFAEIQAGLDEVHRRLS